MYISFFDLFKIGVGPSSSHTVGPIKASNLFANKLIDENFIFNSIKIEIYGSLAYTGKGHGTDFGIVSGLGGYDCEKSDINDLNQIYDNAKKNKSINLLNTGKIIKFDIDTDLTFNFSINKEYTKHSNVIIYKAFNNNECILKKVFYSVGGGFIVDDDNLVTPTSSKIELVYKSAEELIAICNEKSIKIDELIAKNEMQSLNISLHNLNEKVLNIWNVMNRSIYNGMQNSGELLGGLKIKRRANQLYKKLIKSNKEFDPLYVMDWVNIFAIAVSEENASFGRIVTAPTNGAAGIIPAVIKYYVEFIKDSNNDGIIRFLLTASAIGSLYKMNASISGAEAGCQGEVGVACSMAAGGLTAALNGSNMQIENASEIAMEHNLGLTCDPIGGLVQIPCIERNAMGAIKAINAARISLNGSGVHKVSLDDVIKTMRETGKNMSTIYKETSKGGLAVNVTEC